MSLPHFFFYTWVPMTLQRGYAFHGLARCMAEVQGRGMERGFKMRTGRILLPLLRAAQAGHALGTSGCCVLWEQQFHIQGGENASHFPSLSTMGSFSYFCPNPSSFLPEALLSALRAPHEKRRYLKRSGGTNSTPLSHSYHLRRTSRQTPFF